jgi:hypothetical protein
VLYSISSQKEVEVGLSTVVLVVDAITEDTGLDDGILDDKRFDNGILDDETRELEEEDREAVVSRVLPAGEDELVKLLVPEARVLVARLLLNLII